MSMIYSPPETPRALSTTSVDTSGGRGMVRLATPIVRAWRGVALTVVVALGVTAPFILRLKRPYSADVVIAAVSSSKLPQLPGGLAALANLDQSGLQASPSLLAELARSDGVLRAVGTAPVVVGGRRVRVVDAVVRADSGRVPYDQIPETMLRKLRFNISEKTGLISVHFESLDSALARRVVDSLIARTREKFVGVARAQAEELRLAQSARVDSTDRRLRRAQSDLIAFRAANRAVPQYSQLSAEEDRLNQEVSIARQANQQAVADREVAVAKELEQTPALVVVDGMPSPLPTISAQRGGKLVLVTLVSLTIALLWVAVTGSLRARAAAGEPEVLELRDALTNVPGVRRLLR